MGNKPINDFPAGILIPMVLDEDISITSDNQITYTRGIQVGSGGNLDVITAEGRTITLPNLVEGAVYPYRIKRILTGSVATDIIALA